MCRSPQRSGEGFRSWGYKSRCKTSTTGAGNRSQVLHGTSACSHQPATVLAPPVIISLHSLSTWWDQKPPRRHSVVDICEGFNQREKIPVHGAGVSAWMERRKGRSQPSTDVHFYCPYNETMTCWKAEQAGPHDRQHLWISHEQKHTFLLSLVAFWNVLSNQTKM